MKNNIIEQFEQEVEAVVNGPTLPELAERNCQVEEIDERYYMTTGEHLPPYLLVKLANWILSETLKDKTVDKVTNNTYPVMSDRQLKRRESRERSTEENILDFLELKYVKRLDSLKKSRSINIDKI